MTSDASAGTSAEAHHQHRNVSGGSARAAVFGISDGLVSNLAIVLGVAGAGGAPSLVRLAGLAGLIGGAVSMAAGEYVSTTAQAELFNRELERERVELAGRPDHEAAELVALYRDRGIDEAVATEFVTQLMRNPELALATHAREELGAEPGSLGRPLIIAFWSLVAFALGALVPLAPWFVAGGIAATGAAVGLTMVGALLVGSILARFTDRPVMLVAARQLVFTAIPAALTYAVGSVVGVVG